ncbi:MAG TPA: TRAM domain-containing protein [Nitrososphaeraceae archaeon]|jgi:predicted RNA-binding protein with TRAM domain|nr:TRAM domain-containing protein [Nitrososphaeraceae archaeon]
MSYGQYARGYSSTTTSSFSKPVETGKEYVVDITDTGRGGDGIARISGLVIFVKNAKAGDKNLKVKINSVGSRFAIAEVIKPDQKA